MARKTITTRGESIIGIYPEDFKIGHVPGRRGIVRVLCHKDIVRALPESEKASYITNLYYAKEHEIRSAQINEKLKQQNAKNIKNKASIKECAANWKKELELLNSKKTVTEYLRSVDIYIKAVGNHKINDFDREANVKFLSGLASLKKKDGIQTISLNTQRKHARHFKAFLNWCHAAEYMTNPKKFMLPQVPEQEMETYTLEEVDLLERFLMHQSFGPHKQKYQKFNLNIYRAFILARHTLLRTGAIWSLKLECIDLDHGFIRIRENPELEWKPKKMKWPNKPINKTLMAFLEQDLKTRGKDEIYFLDNGKGQPWRNDVAGISRAMKECTTKLGLPGNIKPFHWGIRATFITWLLNEGVDPVKVQHLADHSSLTTTMAYFNTKKSSQQIAVDFLG